jgi:hypothetical protein
MKKGRPSAFVDNHYDKYMDGMKKKMADASVAWKGILILCGFLPRRARVYNCLRYAYNGDVQ